MSTRTLNLAVTEYITVDSRVCHASVTQVVCHMARQPHANEASHVRALQAIGQVSRYCEINPRIPGTYFITVVHGGSLFIASDLVLSTCRRRLFTKLTGNLYSQNGCKTPTTPRISLLLLSTIQTGTNL